jgi:hypothetical protein
MERIRSTIRYLRDDNTGYRELIVASLLLVVVMLIVGISWYPIGMAPCVGVRVVDTVCWTRPDSTTPGGITWYAEQYLLLNQSMNIAVRHCGKVNNCYVVNCSNAIQINQPGYCYTPSGDGPTVIVEGFATGFNLDGGNLKPIPLIVLTPIAVLILCLFVILPLYKASVEAQKSLDQERLLDRS